MNKFLNIFFFFFLVFCILFFCINLKLSAICCLIKTLCKYVNYFLLLLFTSFFIFVYYLPLIFYYLPCVLSIFLFSAFPCIKFYKNCISLKLFGARHLISYFGFCLLPFSFYLAFPFAVSVL